MIIDLCAGYRLATLNKSRVTVSQLGEFGLISRIRRSTRQRAGVLLGIGDDAAWVQCKAGSSLVTSDLLLEGVHFNLKWTSSHALGYKSLAVNLSDIAAMGGIPAYAVTALGIPPSFPAAELDEFYRGLDSLAAKSGVTLIGGDTNAARALIISICVIGHALHRPVTRRGAKIGQDIYVTGTLGDSALALELLKKRSLPKQTPMVTYLLARHHTPTPRVKAGRLLSANRLAQAMIDISDGLLQDLGHLCKQSNVGAIIYQDKLPVSRACRSLAGKRALRYALGGGEDYELLFCAKPSDRLRLDTIKRRLGVPITRIGHCVDAREGIKVLDAQVNSRDLAVKGYDHFKTPRPHHSTLL